MFDNEGHWIDDPLDVVNAKPDFSELGMEPKHKQKKNITLSLSQAIKLRGILNSSGKDLREIVDRHRKGWPPCGWMYHELKADELLKFGKIIDKKIKEL